MRKYLSERDDLQAGLSPQSREQPGRFTVKYLTDAYVTNCKGKVASGDLSPLTLADYIDVGRIVVAEFGRTTDPEKLRPSDFAAFRWKIAEKYGASRLTKTITVSRQIIKWGHESALLDRMPRFGPDFKIASKSKSLLEKSQNGKKLLTRDEIHQLLEAADAKWKAIILLGINGGLGNTNIASLTLSHVDGEWIDYARGTTGIERRIPLWPETQSATQDAIAARPRPKEGAEELLFLSGHGGPLIRVPLVGRKTDLTSPGFRRLADKAGIHRPRMGMYWLRHTFQTVGDGGRDPIATSAIMGHADFTMAGHYREKIEDQRLQAVTDHVRDWLFGDR